MATNFWSLRGRPQIELRAAAGGDAPLTSERDVVYSDAFSAGRGGAVHHPPRGIAPAALWGFVSRLGQLKRGLWIRAQLGARLGWYVAARPGSEGDPADKALLEAWFSSRMRCPQGLAIAARNALFEQGWMGAGYLEILPPRSRSEMARTADGQLRAKPAGIKYIPAAQCAQCLPQPRKTWYGRQTKEYDPLDLQFPRLLYRAVVGSDYQERYLKAFGDPRLISATTGLETSDWNDAASEWIRLGTYHPSNPHGEPHWLAALDEAGNITRNKRWTKSLYDKNVKADMTIAIAGANPLADGGPEWAEDVRQQYRDIGERREHDGKATAVAIWGVEEKDAKITIHSADPITNAHRVLLVFREQDTLDLLSAIGVPRQFVNYVPSSGLGGAGWSDSEAKRFYEDIGVSEQADLADAMDQITDALGIHDWMVRFTSPRLADPKTEAEVNKLIAENPVMTTQEKRDWIGDLPPLSEAMESDGGQIDPGKTLMVGAGQQILTQETIELLAGGGLTPAGAEMNAAATTPEQAALETLAKGANREQVRAALMDARAKLGAEIGRRGLRLIGGGHNHGEDVA